jgi:nitrogen regulatory protein PII
MGQLTVTCQNEGGSLLDETVHLLKEQRLKGDKHMSNLALHPMKEIRIIIQGEHLKFATDLLDNKATGYTIIHNISGKGHHGFHTAHPMFNEMDSIVMLMSVVVPEKVEPILAGLKPLFDRYTGVMFVSDVSVSRVEYFSPRSAPQ